MTEKVRLYTSNTQKVTVSKSWTIITLQKKWKVFYHNAKVINGVFISCITDTNQVDQNKNIDKGDCSISINLLV